MLTGKGARYCPRAPLSQLPFVVFSITSPQGEPPGVVGIRGAAERPPGGWPQPWTVICCQAPRRHPRALPAPRVIATPPLPLEGRTIFFSPPRGTALPFDKLYHIYGWNYNILAPFPSFANLLPKGGAAKLLFNIYFLVRASASH